VNEFATQLGGRGIYIQTGPFWIHLCSGLESVAEGMARLYHEYPRLEERAFADFHLKVDAVSGLRRWFRPQVQFSFDGHIPFKPLPLVQAFPMFEWGLNWCVANHAHDYLIIHAAVVEKGGRAAILPAPPGSGKSTLCAALVNRGWRLFSDELAMFSLQTRELVPLPRPVNLKNDSIDLIQAYAPDAVFGERVSDTNKGTVCHMKAPADSIDRAAEGAAPAWIVMPRYIPNAGSRLERRSKARTCMDVAQNAFNFSLLAEGGFQAVTEILDSCDCYDFSYSRLDDAVQVFDALEAGE
jgi:HprK-related kinase A